MIFINCNDEPPARQTVESYMRIGDPVYPLARIGKNGIDIKIKTGLESGAGELFVVVVSAELVILGTLKIGCS